MTSHYHSLQFITNHFKNHYADPFPPNTKHPPDTMMEHGVPVNPTLTRRRVQRRAVLFLGETKGARHCKICFENAWKEELLKRKMVQGGVP